MLLCTVQVAAVLPRLSREERELLDVERQMEEQLYEQYKQVRVEK